MGLNLSGDPTTLREKKGFWEKKVRRRLRRLKAVKITLECVMGM